MLLACACAVAVLSITVPVSARRTVAQKKQIARTDFQRAQRLREALNGRPEGQRSKRDYQRVEDAFRKVYYTAPTSSKADESVRAVAELLAEQGRVLGDDKASEAAIGQYEFLRKQYPGSKYRVDALFTIGMIYRDDLGDNAKAKDTLDEFLKHYPHSHLAEEAKQALGDIEAEARAPQSKKGKKAEQAEKRERRGTKDDTALPDLTATDQASAKRDSAANATAIDAKQTDRPREAHGRVLVTGIRHWSTPDYTRVAIDLEDEVKYEAGRVPHPDRIFFDLQNAKLASELIGKTFDVGDGFLRKVRIAPFKADTVRVVLDVDDVSEYSAFLLPNPYRLIIDIHGKRAAATSTQTASAKQGADTAAPVNSPLGMQKSSSEGISANAATTQPKDDAESSASEIAKLTQTPAEQKATEKPTSNPVVAKIAPRENHIPRTKNPTKQIESPEGEQEMSAQSGATVAPTPRSSGPKLSEKSSDQSNVAQATSADADSDTDSSSGVRAKLPVRTRNGRRVAQSASIHEAQPTADGDRSLIRALGLKIGRIVVDAGHGGHDTGTIGPNGLLEKDLVLDVALRLGKLLEQKLGAEVVYTRDDDTFVPLETRTAIANKEQADLFISIHANSSPDPSARGVETYYLNFTSSPDALDVAARENAVSEKSIHELQDLVKKIALKEKIEESREFAADVESSLHQGLVAKNPGLKDRGVKKAPFIVLIGANMPSILSEISFVSNPQDERRLERPDYRQKIADSLYRGVAKYVSGLSGVKVASKGQDVSGQ